MISKIFSEKSKAFYSNSFYLYISHFSDYLLSLILLPFIARTVGSLEFGMIGLAQTLGVLILLTVEFGSPLVATREVSRKKNETKYLNKLASEITTLKILLLPILFFLIATVIFLVPSFKNQPSYVLIVGIGSIFQGMTPTWFFHGIEKIKPIALSKILFRFLGFFATIYFVKTPNDGWIYLISFSISSAIICIYLNLKMINQIGFIKLVKPSRIFHVFSKSTKTFLITLVPIVGQNISLVILSIITSPIQLGIFYGANKIYRAFNTLYGPLSQSFFPAISSLGDKNNINSKELIKKYTYLLFSIGTIFFIVNYFFSNLLVGIILGKEYYLSGELLKYFSIIFPLTALSNAFGRQWLMAMNKDNYYLAIITFCSTISLVSFLILSESLGLKAFPLSMIVYEFSTITIILFFVAKNENIQFF